MVGEDGLNWLVNNAAISIKPNDLENVTWDIMSETLAINTISPLMLTQVHFCILVNMSINQE